MRLLGSNSRAHVRWLLILLILALVAAELLTHMPRPHTGESARTRTGSCRHLCEFAAAERHPAAPCPAAPPGDAWAGYGHDNQRTSASSGCIRAPAFSWRYVPVPSRDRKLQTTYHAIATATGVFLEYAASQPPLEGPEIREVFGETALDGLTTAGGYQWTVDGDRDEGLGMWPTLGFGRLFLNDDGVLFVDPSRGDVTRHTVADADGFVADNDVWGDTLADPARQMWYASNVTQAHQRGLYLRGYHVVPGVISPGEGRDRLAWEVNATHTCYNQVGDILGGIAEDRGTLFFGPHYTGDTAVSSGIYAVNPADGHVLWGTTIAPASHISAGGGLVYVIEGDALVAHRQSDGSVAWRQPVTGPGAQAPALADGAVIVAGSTGITAFDSHSGRQRWFSALRGAAAPLTTISQGVACKNAPPASNASNRTYDGATASTTMAAALGSHTLVVTSADGLHILNLATGATTWSGTVPHANGAVRDPVVVGDSLYVTDDDGLIALQG